MAIAEDTGDLGMMHWALAELLRIGHQLDANEGYLIWPTQIDNKPTFGELAQSRLVLSLALIYRATGNANAKQYAMIAFAALERLPLINVTSSITGKTYRLPSYVFHDVRNPVAISGRDLDPNHDAFLAAAYYAMGVFVLDDQAASAQALAKADGYLSAALDMANSGRCLPLADHPAYRNDCDTRYNGTWSAMLEIVVRSGPPREAIRLIDTQFVFARPAILNFETRRTYPEAYVGPYPDPVEPLLWLPSAARNFSADELRAFGDKINQLIETGNSSAWPSGHLYPKYYQLLGDRV